MAKLDRDNITFSDDKDIWLEKIMDKYGERLTKLAFNYLKDWSAAEDVVQDVFITCYNQYESIDKITSFKSWIFRITINKCKDVLKSSLIKKVVMNSKHFDKFSTKALSPEMVMIKRGEEEVLSMCVLSLPIKYREVITLYYYEELTIDEMSEMLKINSNTIKTRLKRARDKLKNKMERGGFNGTSKLT